jgi:hypothetical protein
MKKISIFLFFSIVFISSVKSQAIRANYFCGSAFQKTDGGGGTKFWYWGFGYEQNVGDRIALSLEYNKGFSFGDEAESAQLISGDVSTSGYSMYYLQTMPWNEFSYQSKYFFTDNDDNAWYFSTGLAYRTVTVQVQIEDLMYSSDYEPVLGTLHTGLYSEKVTFTPVSFKLGYRNSIDGFFGDYFLGINYLPGSSKKSINNTFLDQQITTKSFTSVALTFGFAMGFGWAE